MDNGAIELRARLSAAYDAARKQGIGLRAYLEQERLACHEATKTGQLIASTSTPGLSVTHSETGKGADTPKTLLAVWQYLVDRFDTARANLMAAGISAPTDAQVLAGALAVIQPVRKMGVGFSRMLR